MKISGINNNIIKNIQNNKNDNSDKKDSFISVFKEKLHNVNEKQIEAEKATEKFIKGESVDIHQVMISTQEAKLSLELAVEIRNKVVNAYKEINRMQI
jgi:flagellar hook-basal body complex protein FliE